MSLSTSVEAASSVGTPIAILSITAPVGTKLAGSDDARRCWGIGTDLEGVQLDVSPS